MNWLYKLTRKLSRWAWLHEIAATEGIAYLQKMSMDEKSMELEIKTKPEVKEWVAKCFAAMVVDSPNYTEVKFDILGEWEDDPMWVTVTVQKGDGKTPHQLRKEAEQECERLKTLLAKYTEDEPVPPSI